MRGRARSCVVTCLMAMAAVAVVGAFQPAFAQDAVPQQLPTTGVTFEPWPYPVNTFVVQGGTPGPLQQRVIVAAGGEPPVTVAQVTTTTTTPSASGAGAGAGAGAQPSQPAAPAAPSSPATPSGSAGPLATTGVDVKFALFMALIALDVGLVLVFASRTRRVPLLT